MSDPIGTAQERELIERGRTDAAEIEACGAGNEAATMRQLADALQSRIAEVGRLAEALEPFAHFYGLNDCHERSLDDALEVPIRTLRDAWSALSLQRRPT